MRATRRDFISSVAGVTAITALDPSQSAATLIAELNAAPYSSRPRLLESLLLRRQLLIGGSYEADQQGVTSLESIGINLLNEIGHVTKRYLKPLGWRYDLLLPQEARQIKTAVKELKARYASSVKQIRREVEQIDQELRSHNTEISKILDPYAKYYELIYALDEDKMSPAKFKKLEMQLGNLPEPAISFDTISDVSAVLRGDRSENLTRGLKFFEGVGEDVLNAASNWTSVTEAARPKDWQEQRRKAQIEHISDTLNELASNQHVHIRNSLRNGYGDDRWELATRMHSNDIGREQDLYLTNTLKHLKSLIEDTYPEQVKRTNPPLLTHTRPEQPGYGEHDCERLTITNPGFALCETLRTAENTYLKRKNGLNQSQKVA